jgi:type I restriction and modification enzyme subunit R-like protein
MYEGVKKINKEADFVLFNGQSRAKGDALLIVEAKKTEKILTEDAVGQARSYAMCLSTAYYIVTNGDEIRIYMVRVSVQPDVMRMTFKRSDLQQQWAMLYQTLHKKAVIEFKENRSRTLAASGM